MRWRFIFTRCVGGVPGTILPCHGQTFPAVFADVTRPLPDSSPQCQLIVCSVFLFFFYHLRSRITEISKPDVWNCATRFPPRFLSLLCRPDGQVSNSERPSSPLISKLTARLGQEDLHNSADCRYSATGAPSSSPINDCLSGRINTGDKTHVSDALQTDWLFDGLTSLGQIRHRAQHCQRGAVWIKLFLGPGSWAALLQVAAKWMEFPSPKCTD